jgi:hypothetical protein
MCSHACEVVFPAEAISRNEQRGSCSLMKIYVSAVWNVGSCRSDAKGEIQVEVPEE